MVILIAGASHTGKTNLAQQLMKEYGYPYLSIDHLKMGLIRSGNTSLTPLSEDRQLTEYLWPILREIIKTVIENKQNLIIEGCYIPGDWKKDFAEAYLQNIRYLCLVMSEGYIREHFGKIQQYANVAECRLEDGCTIEDLVQDNAAVLEQCRLWKLPYILIELDYLTDLQKGLTYGK